MYLKIVRLIFILMTFVLITSCEGGGGGVIEGDSANEGDGYLSVFFNSRNGTPVESQKISEGGFVEKPEDPVHENAVFSGWYKENACINRWNFESSIPSSDIILYAKWRFNDTPETFSESNRPNLELVTDAVNGDFYLCKPWNYEMSYNSSRKYPLLIYLHGRSQAGYLRNLYYMGYDNPDGYQRDVSAAFKKEYPCFTFVPESGTTWSTAKLIAQIESLKSDYRIDASRIYIHGFSMGAWACYSLANAYYSYNGRLFAGIIRQSGMGTITDDAIAEKTAIWLITGLRTTGSSPESQSTIDDTRAAYNYLKNFPRNAGAAEISRSYAAGSHNAVTWELIKDGWEFAKRTEYTDDGHFTTEYPFIDPSVMAWLFDQSLEYR